MDKSAPCERARLASTAVRRALSGVLFFTAVLAPLRAQADYPEAPVEEQEAAPAKRGRRRGRDGHLACADEKGSH